MSRQKNKKIKKMPREKNDHFGTINSIIPKNTDEEENFSTSEKQET